MNKFITRYNLSGFKELIPLLLRCFPDFWEPRLAAGKYSFPYDLKLFAARLENKLIGCIGIHEYNFLFDNMNYSCGGVSDVAVDPEFRGRGYAVQMQEFFINYCRKNYKSTSLMPLYTDKPGVYLKRGWQIYESDRSNEINAAMFPPEKTFKFDPSRLSQPCLREKKPPRTPEEVMAKRIMEIYLAGKKFNGKCMRSGKTWCELFTAPGHHWQLEANTYFLYQNDLLLEADSSDADSPVSAFTPRHGGFDGGNKLMINLPDNKTDSDKAIALAIQNKSLIFPAADIF